MPDKQRLGYTSMLPLPKIDRYLSSYGESEGLSP